MKKYSALLAFLVLLQLPNDLLAINVGSPVDGAKDGKRDCEEKINGMDSTKHLPNIQNTLGQNNIDQTKAGVDNTAIHGAELKDAGSSQNVDSATAKWASGSSEKQSQTHNYRKAYQECMDAAALSNKNSHDALDAYRKQLEAQANTKNGSSSAPSSPPATRSTAPRARDGFPSPIDGNKQVFKDPSTGQDFTLSPGKDGNHVPVVQGPDGKEWKVTDIDEPFGRIIAEHPETHQKVVLDTWNDNLKNSAYLTDGNPFVTSTSVGPDGNPSPLAPRASTPATEPTVPPPPPPPTGPIKAAAGDFLTPPENWRSAQNPAGNLGGRTVAFENGVPANTGVMRDTNGGMWTIEGLGANGKSNFENYLNGSLSDRSAIFNSGAVQPIIDFPNSQGAAQFTARPNMGSAVTYNSIPDLRFGGQNVSAYNLGNGLFWNQNDGLFEYKKEGGTPTLRRFPVARYNARGMIEDADFSRVPGQIANTRVR